MSHRTKSARKNGSNVGSYLYAPAKSLLREIKIVSTDICGNSGDLASFCFCLVRRYLIFIYSRKVSTGTDRSLDEAECVWLWGWGRRRGNLLQRWGWLREWLEKVLKVEVASKKVSEDEGEQWNGNDDVHDPGQSQV